MPKIARYPIAVLSAAVFLWVAVNAMLQSRQAVPGVGTPARLGFLLTGLPGARQACPPGVHELYTTTGPDGRSYATWHPAYDQGPRCAFDHEHGSDPESYVGFPSAGMPAFGYTAAQAGIQETHAGYKVYVTNDDLLERAWMITAHQDSADPARLTQQFHTLDWHIATAAGESLVSIHVLADYGQAVANCQMDQVINPAGTSNSPQIGQHRALLTVTCAAQNPYESWSAAVYIAGVFEASPLLDIQNPIAAVDAAEPGSLRPTCAFRPEDERCPLPGELGAAPWLGNRRGILHPGQFVNNPGQERFTTDAYGSPVDDSAPGAIMQYVTHQGWDSRDCCGEDVVFYIQTWSDGVYIAAPNEPAGSAEFWYR